MATYINPSAIKDGTISASKTDETIATKEELTELSLKVGELENSKQNKLTPGDGISIVNNVISATGGSGGCIPDAPVDGKQYARQDGTWSEVQGGGDTPWTLKYEHTFVADEPTLTITDIGSNFLLLIDYNGTLAVAKNVLMEYGNNTIRVNNPFSANRQMHMSVELHNDGTITSVESSYSEWSNFEASNSTMVKRELAKQNSISIYSTNGRIPEGTILKLYEK